MGYFSDMLEKMNQVDAIGFNPYVDSYSARIGQLQAIEMTNPTNPTTPQNDGNKDTYSSQDISNFLGTAGLGTKDTSLGQSNFNSLINRADELGIDKQRLVNTYNQNIKPEEQIIINPDKGGSISVVKAKPHTYKFEIGRNQYKEGDDKNVYIRRDLTTGENITYDNKQAYEDALSEYKKVTGIETTNYL